MCVWLVYGFIILFYYKINVFNLVILFFVVNLKLFFKFFNRFIFLVNNFLIFIELLMCLWVFKCKFIRFKIFLILFK